jgi:hypothetical protein
LSAAWAGPEVKIDSKLKPFNLAIVF